MNLSKNLIIFMPSIDGGGVEKKSNNYSKLLDKKFSKITVITYDKKFNSKFNKKIDIINYKKKSSGEKKYFKYFICLMLLVKELFKNKKSIGIFFFRLISMFYFYQYSLIQNNHKI